MTKKYALIAISTLLAACSPQEDMQGVDPNAYYAAHPIVNTLQPHSLSYVAHFMPKETRLSPMELEKLRAALRDISPPSADAVHIGLSQADMHNDARRAYLNRLLNNMGYARGIIEFTASATLAHDDVQIDIAYVTVAAPDCPDWRMSPQTTYSNTHQGNFGCAQEVNVGAMVADPHDLARGTGDVAIGSERAAHAVYDYRSGKDYSATAASASSTSASAGASNVGAGASSASGSGGGQ